MTAFATTARSAKRTRQTLLRLSALSLVVMLATAFAAAPAFAAKPDKGSSGSDYSTIELAGVSAARSGEPTFSRGSDVKFDTKVVGLKGREYPMVYVECYADNGTKLYGRLDHPDSSFRLGGYSSNSAWMSMEPAPDATCFSHLYAYGNKVKGVLVVRELTDPAAGVLTFAAKG